MVFQNNHDFNEWQTGLTFIGILCGMIVAVCCDPLWKKNCEHILVAHHCGNSDPEIRYKAGPEQ